MNEVEEDFALPELRSDLQLIEGPVALDGSPSWLIVDPVRNKYFSIGWAAFQFLSRWSIGKASDLLASIKSETALESDQEDIKELIAFLYRNSLTRYSASGSSEDYMEQYQASKPAFLVWLVHHYLFFKIPLVRPTRFLRSTLVFVEPIYSNTSRFFILLLGIVGLFMVSRQWESFVSTFLYFFNLQGMFFYFLSLVFIKVMHELAHAYTVIRYGCKVPTMGIAFLVMFPILYTDTSDTWRIKSSTERIHVGAAGMLMEFYIACLATFCWSFLPEGYLKSAAFILATTSWILSLVINLNPLMRFDGYYILSDLLGIQNLQARSFEVGKWRLTELLFGLKLRPPEALSRNNLRKLTVYAWCVWVYRFFLFIGIALLVYHFFFKVLGIVLFAIEILWFIVLPVLGMFVRWWELKGKIVKTKRFYITLTISVLMLSLFFIPWQSSVKMPAMLQSGKKITIFAPAPAYIESNLLAENKWVDKDDVLLKLKSPQIERDIDLTKQEIEYLRLQAKRIAASEKDLANVQVIIQQLQESRSKLDGLISQQQKLVIKAPFSGTIRDVDQSLHENRWINKKLPLATIIRPYATVIEGVMQEKDLKRVSTQATVKFIPDSPEENAIWGFVSDIEEANLKILDLESLASVYGGKVPSTLNQDNKIVPDRSVYRVRMAVSEVEKLRVDQDRRGVVHIEAESESLLVRAYKLVASVLIRESGF